MLRGNCSLNQTSRVGFPQVLQPALQPRLGPRTTAPCSAPFPSHQSPHLVLTWRVNIISLKGDKANHAPPSPEVPGLAWVPEQRAVRTLDHGSLRRIGSLKENQADQLRPPAASPFLPPQPAEAPLVSLVRGGGFFWLFCLFFGS